MGKWEEVKFADVVDNFDGKRIPIKASERKNSEGVKYPYYGASGIIDYVDDFIFEGEHLLISEDGANLLARVYPIAFKADGKFWVNNHAHIVKAKKEKTTNDYLEYYLSSINISEYVTGSAQPKLNQKKLNSIKIPLPPLPEQQRIVAKLDGLFAKIDQAISLLEENILHTKALMGSVLDVIFSNGDTMLKDACLIGPKKSEVRDLEDDLEVSFLPMRDLNEHDINFVSTEIKNKGEVYKGYTYFADGDVILAKVTPCFENGKAGLAKDLLNGIGFGSSEYHILRPNENILPEWVYFSVLTEQFRVTGKENMTGAGGLKRIPRPFLEEWKIPLPELPIQKKQIKRIVQIQEETKKLETSIQVKLNHLKALKSSLLDQAFKGEL